MKKIGILLMIALAAAVLLAGCTGKDDNNEFAESRSNQPLVQVPENFVHIPGGTYTIGPAAVAPGNPQQARPEVTVSSFCMAVHPVTQKEYQEVMGTNPGSYKGDHRPIDQVTWFDAIEYCNRLSRRDGLTPAYLINEANVTWNRSTDGYRLPTEAEWEYAARAGTTVPFDADGSHPWGLKEMPGELWEWCWDWYDIYPGGTLSDPAGAESGINRVMRGGVYGMCEPRGTVVRIRDYGVPSEHGSNIGFRLVSPL